LYAEAQGNYTKVVTVNTTLLTKVSFSTFIEQLPYGPFIRVHRSFIINKQHIGHLEGNRVFIRDVEIPIASHYKGAFLKSIGFDKKA
jgi:two-component system LytT family response regulator